MSVIFIVVVINSLGVFLSSIGTIVENQGLLSRCNPPQNPSRFHFKYI